MYRQHTYQPRLMGALIGVNAGDGFALGFNVSWSMFGPSAEDIAPWLQQMNLAHSVVSEQIAGVVNPYISVVGLASGNWTAPSAFRDALLAAIAELGFEIDYNSVTYRITPRVGGVPVQTPSPTPRPAPTSSPQVRPRPGESTPDESVYFTVGTDYLPGTTNQERPYVPPPLPTEKKGISPLMWLGLGLILVVAVAARD